MTKYKLNEERRSHSDVTLTSYLVGAGNERFTQKDHPAYSNPALDSSDVPNTYNMEGRLQAHSDKLDVNNCVDKSK